jgi:hypothetical protein
MYSEGATEILTSVASPGTATSIDTRGFRTGMIAIRNYGGEDMHTLQYVIKSYANYAGATAGAEEVSIADIAPNATVTFVWTEKARARFEVTITPKVVGDQSQYKIEHCLAL